MGTMGQLLTLNIAFRSLSSIRSTRGIQSNGRFDDLASFLLIVGRILKYSKARCLFFTYYVYKPPVVWCSVMSSWNRAHTSIT